MTQGDDFVKVEVGFIGAQVLSLRMEEPQLEDLVKAATSGQEWHQCRVEDGQVSLDLGKVTYIKTDSEVSRIGF